MRLGDWTARDRRRDDLGVADIEVLLFGEEELFGASLGALGLSSLVREGVAESAAHTAGPQAMQGTGEGPRGDGRIPGVGIRALAAAARVLGQGAVQLVGVILEGKMGMGKGERTAGRA